MAVSAGINEVDQAINRILAGVSADRVESSTLDFKEDKSSLSDTEKLIAEAAICFANSAGGFIVAGVSDKITGQDAIIGSKLDPDKLKQRIYELTRPHLNVDITKHPKYPTLLIINVPQSADIHSDTQGRATRRINTNCLPMGPDDQARLREERNGIDWSAQPSARSIDDVSSEALNMTRTILQRFNDNRRQLASLSPHDLLSAIGAIHQSGSLNNAGELMFCAPHGERHHDIVYQYRSTPGGEPKLVQRLEQPFAVAFARVIELVEARQSLTPVTLPNGQQISIEDFPSLAVREAVSNAICHRDYHLSSSVVSEHSPEVFIVTSPGPLVSGVTPQNIITTNSRPRNPALSKIARVLGFAEELGRGVDRMYREMIRSGREIPTIDGEFDRVRVTLVGGAPNTQIARYVATLPEDEREDTDTMLILYRLCSTKTISAANCASWLQKTQQEAEAVLRRLAGDQIGLLERTRATIGRSTPIYRLRDGALKALGSAVAYQRRTTDEIDRKVIAHVREYGKITNKTLQNFFDVHVYRARDIISDLVKREILIRTSENQRGPKVEWGPGPKFPSTRSKARKTASKQDDQLTFEMDDE